MRTDTKTWAAILSDGVESVRAFKRAQVRCDEWFFVQEIRMEEREALLREGKVPDSPAGVAELLCRIARRCPLSILPGSAIAGSQDGAFSPSYALINSDFKVKDFAGYCDPTAIYADVTPDPAAGLTRERIENVRRYWEETAYVRGLKEIYDAAGAETREVAYFMEPVTGHTIPDLRPYLKHGVVAMQQRALASETAYGAAMARALEAVLILGERYHALALSGAATAGDGDEASRLAQIADVLGRVPADGARTLHEAVQAFALLWQAMALEQAPNPYAFSVGNLDRVLEPFFDTATTPRDEAVALVRHLLCLFQVGRSCWAISQNVLVGGRDAGGTDLTSPMTGVILDAFFTSNDPQPALSVKVHAGTPESLFRALGPFFFTPGHLTPSLFNDDTVFELLKRGGVADEDLPDYAIAGCQEPLVMGRSSLNTTNTWLNLGKVLELALNDGRSLISGGQIGPGWRELGFGGCAEAYASLEQVFFATLDHFLPRMRDAGNACTTLLGREKPVPLTSALMDGIATLRDMRDPADPGVRYHASGCLVHGLTVAADSLHAVRRALASGRFTAQEIRAALASDFEDAGPLRTFLLSQDKCGNDCADVDGIAARIVSEVGARIGALRTPAGGRFLADWSTPSTHLLYGWWVGATPDGRPARTMLNYGVDPLPRSVRSDLPVRIVSAWKLPYLAMTGGCASHVGISPGAARTPADLGDKGLWLRDQVIRPLFRLGDGEPETPFYVYFNVDDASHLRAVIHDPATHAPSGVYIVRIHGTFVNLLDLSPEVREDIITRLDAGAGGG